MGALRFVVVAITTMTLITAKFPQVMNMTGKLFENNEKGQSRAQIRTANAVIVSMFKTRPFDRWSGSE